MLKCYFKNFKKIVRHLRILENLIGGFLNPNNMSYIFLKPKKSQESIFHNYRSFVVPQQYFHKTISKYYDIAL